MYAVDRKLLRDLLTFSRRQYESLDYDPFHPMMFHLERGLPTEEALWFSTLYMAFYNIGSAYAAFKLAPSWSRELPDWAGRILPVGVQRRNLRGGLVMRHLADVQARARSAGSLHAVLTGGFVGDPSADWKTLQQTLLSFWGNGRWAAYTTGELYQKVNQLPVLPTDIMNDGSSGPRAGLSRLYGCPTNNTAANLELLDALAAKLFAKMRKELNTRIFYLPDDHYDYGMLESQLCDFNSLCKGRYYVGRDIDRDQERIMKVERLRRVVDKLHKVSLTPVWEAREAVFDRRYLGEFNQWLGRTAYALKFYQQTGVVEDHMTIREHVRGGLLL